MAPDLLALLIAFFVPGTQLGAVVPISPTCALVTVVACTPDPATGQWVLTYETITVCDGASPP